MSNLHEEDEITPERARQMLDESDRRTGRYVQSVDADSARGKFQQLNEQIVKHNPALGLIDERIMYDKRFLLEVQNAGYNPLDSEDVKNYIENLPSKYENRNMILCGADKYTNMGMSTYGESNLEEFQKFMGSEGIDVPITTRKPEDVYLSDFNNKTSRSLLTEEESERHKLNMDTFIPDPTFVGTPSETHEKLSMASIEDRYRKHLSKAFGSEDATVPKPIEDSFVTDRGMIKSDSKTEKLLELIKELRALGFSADEIKHEINNLNR